MDPEKLLERLRHGSIRNVRFRDMVRVLESLGFRLRRTHGSHHIYARPDVPELINLQNVGGEAKPYQIRQVLRLVERYSLRLEEET
jgi:predicted RNA binding protein YcfA (HicA-like mRNA interferase family)